MLLLDWSSSNFVSSRPLCHFRLFPTADTQKLMSFSSLSFSGKGMIKVLNAVVYPLAVLIQSDYAGRRRNVNPVVVVSSKPFFDCATAGKDKKKKKVGDDPISVCNPPEQKKRKKSFFLYIHCCCDYLLSPAYVDSSSSHTKMRKTNKKNPPGVGY